MRCSGARRYEFEVQDGASQRVPALATSRTGRRAGASGAKLRAGPPDFCTVYRTPPPDSASDAKNDSGLAGIATQPPVSVASIWRV